MFLLDQALRGGGLSMQKKKSTAVSLEISVQKAILSETMQSTTRN